MLGPRLPHFAVRPTRRNLLLGAGGLALVAAGLAGCTSGTGGGDERPDDPPEPDPDRDVLGQARDAAAALLARYDATLRVHADTADRLGPLRDIHRRHLATLEAAATAAGRGAVGADQLRPKPLKETPDGPTPGGSQSESPSPDSLSQGSPSASDDPATPDGPAVPESRSAALTALRKSERATARSHRQRLTRAKSGQVARVFASLAAAGEQNATYLEAGGDD